MRNTEQRRLDDAIEDVETEYEGRIEDLEEALEVLEAEAPDTAAKARELYLQWLNDLLDGGRDEEIAAEIEAQPEVQQAIVRLQRELTRNQRPTAMQANDEAG